MTKSNSQDQELQEAITQLIEQASANTKYPFLKDFSFHVILAADENDRVKVSVDWPKSASVEKSAEVMSSILFHISEGHWTLPIVQAIKNRGEEDDCQPTSMAILNAWKDKTQTKDSLDESQFVLPSRVFRKE